MAECLWVVDTREKIDRGTGNGLDPEKFRCKPTGKVFCTPCGKSFFGETWGQSVAEQQEPYSISREQLAQMVAAHTCGLADAIPEQQDFDIADKMLKLLEDELAEDRGPCPRCRGDHSWCQSVQPGEYGPE